ncbi:MAG: hypothetical protein SLAVMIC_00455 [uncultured marine phage]|uniref:Uncharacterized protein n=1 Tax=uncultured marine phage TaxID=707152 RepID=A0A8D9CA26_9VIRU|nr:MAG: hypothetical protein SLAVMIC_00455 [uncultured marine phage]
MKYIKDYRSYKESVQIDLTDQNLSDLLESLTIWEDSLLSSIKAEEQDIVEVFKYVRDTKGKLDIEELSDDTKFVEALSNIGLRKSTVQNTDDFETFIDKTLKFMPIFKVDDNDLMNPIFLMLQSWNESLNGWNDVKLYRVNDDIKKFYDKLSSKTIEITDKSDNKNYIYVTANSGNDWELKNLKDETESFKKFLRNEELKDLVSSKDLVVSIV